MDQTIRAMAAQTPAQAAEAFFAANPMQWAAMCDFISGKNKPISLREIDTFMHVHAEQLDVVQSDTKLPDLLCNDYARLLREAGGKRECSPFSRKDQSRDVTLHGQTLRTSSAQLVFFHWALCHDLFKRAADFIKHEPPKKAPDYPVVKKRKKRPAPRRRCAKKATLAVSSATGVDTILE